MNSPFPAFYREPHEFLDQITPTLEYSHGSHESMEPSHWLTGDGLCQTFKCDRTGELTKLILNAKSFDNRTCVYNLDIYAVDGNGFPTGVSLANATIYEEPLGANFEEIENSFSLPPHLIAGVTYAFVISYVSGSLPSLSLELGDDYLRDVYLDGECYADYGDGWEKWDYDYPSWFNDLVFKTYITV